MDKFLCPVASASFLSAPSHNRSQDHERNKGRDVGDANKPNYRFSQQDEESEIHSRYWRIPRRYSDTPVPFLTGNPDRARWVCVSHVEFTHSLKHPMKCKCMYTSENLAEFKGRIFTLEEQYQSCVLIRSRSNTSLLLVRDDLFLMRTAWSERVPLYCTAFLYLHTELEVSRWIYNVLGEIILARTFL